MKRVIKNLFKGVVDSLKELVIIKKVVINITYIIVGVLYLIDLILDKLYDFISLFYKSINKRLQKLLFYSMIVMSFNYVNDYIKNDLIKNISVPEVQALEIKEVKETETLEVEAITKVDEINKCDMDNTSCKIKEVSERYGIDYKIAIAIAKHETGNYTSAAFKQRNNVGGMMCSNQLMTFDNLDAGIEAFVSNLKRLYFDLGLNTLELIQPKYCPIGAANDPTGLNQFWLSGTTKYLNEIK